MAAVKELTTLDISQFEAQLLGEVVVNEAGGRGGEVGGHQDHKGAALTGKHVLLLVVAIGVVGGKGSILNGAVVCHRWIWFEILSEASLISARKDLVKFDTLESSS